LKKGFDRGMAMAIAGISEQLMESCPRPSKRS